MTPPSAVSALARAKWAFTTRRVPPDAAGDLLRDVARVVIGDLVLCEVAEIGQHKKIQLRSGRYALLYPGDRVVLACGARYAPDQFEAEAVLDPDGADMVAGGGLVGRARMAHERMSPPTRVRPLARLAGASGRPLNLSGFALPRRTAGAARPAVIAVIGSSMNAGKTMTAACLARGLAGAGLHVGGAKLTGTGASADYNAFLDAGIADVLDFTDAGLPSTYGQPLDRLERIAETLIGELGARGVDVAVVEVADGAFQQETAALIRSTRFAALCDGVVFAAADALGAATGVDRVRQAGLTVLGISGLVTCSPLASAEAARETGQHCYRRDDLLAPDTARELLRRASMPGGRSKTEAGKGSAGVAA